MEPAKSSSSSTKSTGTSPEHVPESSSSMRRERTEWTREQHMVFERALAQVPEDLPDRWQKVADLVPGASPDEMKERYDDLVRDVLAIEAGQFDSMLEAMAAMPKRKHGATPKRKHGATKGRK